jgi:2,5-diketo-D-gluconate reductase B
MTVTTDIPLLGLGTFGRTGEKGVTDILAAIEVGYRHLDTAQTYDSEDSVGAAIRSSGLPRGDFFVTTKVADYNLGRDRFLPSVEESLQTLDIGPVDLLLIHWPSPRDAVPLEHYIEALAAARDKGHARLIGASNFTVAHLKSAERILGTGALATNQVELNPFLQAPVLTRHARQIGLSLTAYLPIARGKVNEDAVISGIAARHGCSNAAVALAFLMAEGHIAIPASAKPERLRESFKALDVKLELSEIAAIRRLDRSERIINPDLSPKWDD